MIFPLVQFGSVYLTSNNASDGTRYICEVEGLDTIALNSTIQTIRALDGTIYSQYQAVKDTELTIRVPRMDFSKFDAVRDVIQTAITGNTTYSLNVTANGESFTFTAKPISITYDPTILADTVENVEFRQFVTD